MAGIGISLKLGKGFREVLSPFVDYPAVIVGMSFVVFWSFGRLVRKEKNFLTRLIMLGGLHVGLRFYKR